MFKQSIGNHLCIEICIDDAKVIKLRVFKKKLVVVEHMKINSEVFK